MRGKPFQAEEIEQAILDLFLAPTPSTKSTKARSSR